MRKAAFKRLARSSAAPTVRPPVVKLPPFDLGSVADLNRLDDALLKLGESCMNVGWKGEPSDPYVRQLYDDAGKLCEIVQMLRDALAGHAGAVWLRSSERFHAGAELATVATSEDEGLISEEALEIVRRREAEEEADL